MSQFTQFVAPSVPVGGFAYFTPFTSSYNFTYAGQEYLQTGVLKSYTATYSPLVTAKRDYGVSDAVTNPNSSLSAPTWFVSSQRNISFAYQVEFYKTRWYKTNGQFFRVFHGYPSQYAGTWSAYQMTSGSITAQPVNGTLTLSGGSQISYDSTLFKSLIIQSINNASNVVLYSYQDATSLTLGQTCAFTEAYWLANSPTLAVAIKNTAQNAGSGAIYTSTNGTTWTARTGNISVGTVAYLAYSTVGGNFIVVNTSGGISTSTDGFTWTSRTAPTGMPTSLGMPTGYNSTYNSASSATATLIYLGNVSSNNPLTGVNILKTTNGTTFSLVNVSDKLDVMPQLSNTYVGVGIIHDGTRFVFFPYGTAYNQWFTFSYVNNFDHQALVTSADDGVTFELQTTKAPATFWKTTASANTGARGQNGTINSVAYIPGSGEWFIEFQGFADVGGYANYNGIWPFVFTGRIYNDTPQFVGVTGEYVFGSANTNVGIRTVVPYLRIA